jgi:hypothetical protein
MVLHDLNLAARYSDEIVVMRDGVVVCEGDPATVLTPVMLAETFGLEADVLPDPRTGLPIIVPAFCAGLVQHTSPRDHVLTHAQASDDHGSSRRHTVGRWTVTPDRVASSSSVRIVTSRSSPR